MATTQHVPSETSRVLVVDDEPDVRGTLRDYLAAHGYEVMEADCGQAMRAALDEATPDVVLLDVGLPGEDGLRLARYLRERSRSCASWSAGMAPAGVEARSTGPVPSTGLYPRSGKDFKGFGQRYPSPVS